MSGNIVRLGLYGAHRSGKTTLARHISEELGVPFVETTSAKVFERYGLTPNSHIDIRHRLAIQCDILREAVDLWAAQPDGFVTDRTPIDMAAYMLAEVTGEVSGTLDMDFVKAYEKYVSHLHQASKLFECVVHCTPPLIKIEDAEFKAKSCPIYGVHLAALMETTARSWFPEHLNFRIPQNMTDLDTRKKMSVEIYSVVNQAFNDAKIEMAKEEQQAATLQ